MSVSLVGNLSDILSVVSVIATGYVTEGYGAQRHRVPIKAMGHVKYCHMNTPLKGNPGYLTFTYSVNVIILTIHLACKLV